MEGAFGTEQGGGLDVEQGLPGLALEVWLGKLVLILSSGVVIILEMGTQ